MNTPEDPSRLADDASMPAGLRETLQAARADVGSEAQLARLAERLGPVLGPALPLPSTAGPGAGAGAAMGGAAKAGLGALALLIAGGGAWLLSKSEPEPQPRPTGAPPSAPLGPPAALPPLPAPVVQNGKPEAAAPPAPAEPSSRPLPSKPPTPALSEAELLEQARSALKSDPARALSRASEHRARFPRGVLVQEREVIAIQALRQLGRGAEADKRADAFSKSFPGSAFQRKLKPTP